MKLNGTSYAEKEFDAKDDAGMFDFELSPTMIQRSHMMFEFVPPRRR